MKRSVLRSVRIGAITGILLGLVDVSARIAALRFDWIEIYQALLIPLVLFSILFWILGWFCSLAVSRAIGETAILLLSVCFALAFSAAQLARHKFTLQSGVVVVAAMATAFLGHLILRRGKAVIQDNILLFVAVSTLTCLGIDIAQLCALPKHRIESELLRPNVVLVTLDTVRADRLEPYGYNRPTSPNLKKFAEHAAVFENAYSTTSWTLPAHASLFTGQFVNHHGAGEGDRALPDGAVTLAERYAKAGYATAGFVGGPYLNRRYGVAQGFDYYSDRLDFFPSKLTFNFFGIGGLLEKKWNLLGANGERDGASINRELFRWLDENKKSSFFLFVNYYDAHHPYVSGKEFRSSMGVAERSDEGKLNDMVEDLYYGPTSRYENSRPSQDVIDFLSGSYDAEVAETDRNFGELLQKLEQLNLSENTLIVVASDHGEEFFEHGGVYHRLTLFNEVLHVPLMMSFPYRIVPKRYKNLVGIVDVAPTILFMTLGRHEPLDGESLADQLLGGPVRQHAPLFAELSPKFGELYQRAVITEPYKLIDVSSPKGRVVNGLFNLAVDPGEKENLWDKLPDKREELENLLKVQ